MDEINYKDLGNKRVEITYKGKILKFELAINRSHIVLLELLSKYPGYIDIHRDLDNKLNDPNRALSDLRNDDGFGAFLEETKNARRVIQIKLNIPLLFQVYKDHSSNKFIHLSVGTRQNPSRRLQTILFLKFKGRCNITKVPLKRSIQGSVFMKNFQLVAYDHRIPLTKGGRASPNNSANWQILSEITNREKLKICNACDNPNCKICALAFPEESHTIVQNNQDIGDLINLYKEPK